MPKTVDATKTEIQSALRATGRSSPVLSAHKQGGYIILYLCGDKEPVRWKPPAKTPKKKAKLTSAGG